MTSVVLVHIDSVFKFDVDRLSIFWKYFERYLDLFFAGHSYGCEVVDSTLSLIYFFKAQVCVWPRRFLEKPVTSAGTAPRA